MIAKRSDASFVFAQNARRGICVLGRAHEGAEGGGSHAGDFAEGAGEVALVGKAGGEADFGEGSFGREHSFTSGPDAEAMNIFADAFTDATAEDTGEMHGMDAGFLCQLVQSEAQAMLRLQFVEDAG